MFHVKQFDFYLFEERAAVMEYDGGLSRAEAEDRAARAQGVTRQWVLSNYKELKSFADKSNQKPRW
jgi:hypothetical protein